MAKREKPDLSAHYDRLRNLMVIARKVRSLTQREIAGRIGQPPSFVGKFENGTRGLDVVEFVAIAKAIGVDPRRIITKLLKGWPDALVQPQASKTENPSQHDSAL